MRPFGARMNRPSSGKPLTVVFSMCTAPPFALSQSMPPVSVPWWLTLRPRSTTVSVDWMSISTTVDWPGNPGSGIPVTGDRPACTPGGTMTETDLWICIAPYPAESSATTSPPA